MLLSLAFLMGRLLADYCPSMARNVSNVSCIDPNEYYNDVMAYSCTNDFYAGSYCKLKCARNYQMMGTLDGKTIYRNRIRCGDCQWFNGCSWLAFRQFTCDLGCARPTKKLWISNFRVMTDYSIGLSPSYFAAISGGKVFKAEHDALLARLRLKPTEDLTTGPT